MSFAEGRLFFLCPLVPRGTGFSGRLMPAGHLLFCATKKVSKKVAGNAIPRSRLWCRAGKSHIPGPASLYPCFDTNVRSRKSFLNLQLNVPGFPLLFIYQVEAVNPHRDKEQKAGTILSPTALYRPFQPASTGHAPDDHAPGRKPIDSYIFVFCELRTGCPQTTLPTET